MTDEEILLTSKGDINAVSKALLDRLDRKIEQSNPEYAMAKAKQGIVNSQLQFALNDIILESNNKYWQRTKLSYRVKKFFAYICNNIKKKL